EPSTSGSAWVPNPTGRNQHSMCPPANDERVREILTKYDHEEIKDPACIKKMLEREYGIYMLERTISQRRQTFGLLSSGQTTKLLSDTLKKQLVLDQLTKDPLMRKGPDTIKEAIRQETGYDLTQ
ncbi:hypothetical protein M422DRAFT_127950, partial [Sphaerobolus stellatus SS14]